MKKEKNNVGIIMLLLAVIVFLLIVIVVLFINLTSIKTNEQNLQSNNSNVDGVLNENITQTESDEYVLNMFVGEWGMCDENNGCYGVIIAKDGNNNYTYNPYFMWSDGGNIGSINSVKKMDNNEYELTVYFPERESAGSFYEESTEKIVISMNNNDIVINNIKYQKITIDREQFFQSLIS